MEIVIDINKPETNEETNEETKVEKNTITKFKMLWLISTNRNTFFP